MEKETTDTAAETPMVYGRRKPENGKEITFFTNLDIIQEM
jgi:hypothetical protein